MASRSRSRGGLIADSKERRWSYDELRRKLDEFEHELREAGLADKSVQTYVNRSEIFLRWLIGDYRPRGPQ